MVREFKRKLYQRKSKIIDENNFLSNLRRYVPEFKEIEREEGVESGDGVDYVMGVLSKFAEEANQANNIRLLRKISKFLDKCWNRGEYQVHNAVMVSFFESLTDESFKKISLFLDDVLLEEAKHYRKQWKEWLKTGKWKGLHFKYNHYWTEKEKEEIDKCLKRIRE